MKVVFHLFVGLCVVVLTGCASNVQKRIPVGWTVPMNDLGFDGTLDHLAEPHNWDVKQVSSYDRTGGNADDRDGHQVYDGGVVLADLTGPGIVTRIWSKNPHGTLYIYVDDMEHPIITTEFKDLFSGNLEYWSPGFNLFSPPFTGETSGGYYSYVPIPFRERCRIIVATEEDTLGYQVTYAELPEGTPIESFQLTLGHDDAIYFRNWKDELEDTNFRFHNRKTETLHHSRHKYWPAKNTLVLPMEGPGVITELEMVVESYEKEIMDNTWIAIFFDDQEEPGVLAPIGDFFGAMTHDVDDYDTVVLGRDKGRMWCRYPMPFKKSAEIRFITLSDQIADIEYFITWRKGPIENQNYFYARYNSGVSIQGEPFRVAEMKGKGHMVGASIAAADGDSLTFLEGDDTFTIDGRSKDEHHGTGTDDYFNAGWYFSSGSETAPTHAVTRKSAKSPTGFSAFRSHYSDPVPFNNSFAFDLEHGPENNRPGVEYSSVVYWYQPNSQSALWNIPEMSGRMLRNK